MTTCREIEDRLTPFADGELPPVERAEVEGHLEECPPCRDAAEAQSGCRALLRARAGRLRCQAPDGLVERCSALRCRSGRPTWIPVTVAATVLLALGGVTLWGLTGASGRVLAAQLALDHLTCQTLGRDHVAETVEPAEAAARFAREYGWQIDIPAAPPEAGARFLHVRRCLYARGASAHAMYQVAGKTVSLFMLERLDAPVTETAILGQHAHSWSEGPRTYAVVADLPADRVGRLTTYFRAELARGP